MQLIHGNPDAPGNHVYFIRVEFATGWVPWTPEETDADSVEATALAVSYLETPDRAVQVCKQRKLPDWLPHPPENPVKVVSEYLNGVKQTEISAD